MNALLTVLLSALIVHALGFIAALESLERVTQRNPEQMCQACRARLVLHREREEAWRDECGPAGPALMLQHDASLWCVTPLIAVLRRARQIPNPPRCAGPTCAANRRHTSTTVL
ncbi:hypothetical protein B0I32_106220 [Nonomuraea fuscirosea]|uniref:Uncharacterized protein n=1 Tax=Nonomuraea fuscirosea TaxID=1291556 RepID=A0A2T0N278_9ACTN|nr:hypothetical protein [Nonomuraea fuscirosea]PRX66084.1 hypothetical protein B0I32_106220 [Nonomuraea fuscirosea]